MNVYEWADSAINLSPSYSMGFTQLLATSPYIISSDTRKLYEQRFSLIRDFQNTCLNIFRDALIDNSSTNLIHWLLNETPNSFGISYHRSLEDQHYTLPMFFRTDEITFGKIVEIQCPGSLWGELQLVYDYAAKLGKNECNKSPALKLATQLINILNEEPIVHHLLDNSSAPAGMRYFIEKTRPFIKYWGIDYNIWPEHCNFIRSHSFFGLCGDNDFRLRMEKVGRGVTYDLPPHILFDQKASLVLPFWSLTRKFFSDEIRNLFVYTTPLLPCGIELPDGSRMTIEEFSKMPRSKRAYYLKYAGSDVSLNWGSKAVFRLSNMNQADCLNFLQKCISRYDNGHIWLLQKEDTHNDEVTFIGRDGSINVKNLRSKFSAFYGPSGCIDILAMHRNHNKVHGQADTVVSYVLSNEHNV